MRSLEELTDSDAGDGGVGHLIPDDVYANMILEGVVCYGQLSGVVTAIEYDFTAGGGNTIQVPYVSPRTHSCASDRVECACLSDTSTTFGTYPIKVTNWGDYDLVCGFSLWEAGDPSKMPIMSSILKEMSKRMAKCRDEEIWSALTDDIASTGVTHFKFSSTSCGDGQILTGTASCCTWSYELYNSIISVVADLRDDAYEPDFVVMSPSVAKALYMKDNSGFFNTPLVRFNNDRLVEIAGLKVIECCNAHACSTDGGKAASADTEVTDADGIMAVVLDSKRSIGEAWGKKPKFSMFYDAKCDRTEVVCWQYWGTSAMDPASIGWIANP